MSHENFRARVGILNYSRVALGESRGKIFFFFYLLIWIKVSVIEGINYILYKKRCLWPKGVLYMLRGDEHQSFTSVDWTQNTSWASRLE